MKHHLYFYTWYLDVRSFVFLSLRHTWLKMFIKNRKNQKQIGNICSQFLLIRIPLDSWQIPPLNWTNMLSIKVSDTFTILPSVYLFRSFALNFHFQLILIVLSMCFVSWLGSHTCVTYETKAMSAIVVTTVW